MLYYRNSVRNENTSRFRKKQFPEDAGPPRTIRRVGKDYFKTMTFPFQERKRSSNIQCEERKEGAAGKRERISRARTGNISTAATKEAPCWAARYATLPVPEKRSRKERPCKGPRILKSAPRTFPEVGRTSLGGAPFFPLVTAKTPFQQVAQVKRRRRRRSIDSASQSSEPYLRELRVLNQSKTGSNTALFL